MNETDPFGIHDAELAAQLWPEVIDFLHGELS